MKKLLLSGLILTSIPLSAQTIDFNLKAQVFDGGQKITAIELETRNLKFKRQKLTPETFGVYVKGKLPIDAQENQVFGLADGERKIKQAKVNQNGNIELLLDDNQADTLAYIGGEIARNVEQQLDYQISLKQSGFWAENTQFKQNKIVDNEVDRFTAKTSKSGLNYQWFSPVLQNSAKKQPLVIWLHGNGESGVGEYQNNRSQLLANRGAVSLVESKTQQLFGGAYVVAPQAPDTWYNNYSKDYIRKVKSLIDEVVVNHSVDKERIYLLGASAGGYMALRLYIEFPDFFAAAAVSAPALDRAPQVGGKETTETDLTKIRNKPLWLVHSVNDPTISYTKTSKRVFQSLRDYGAILTVYPAVRIGDKEYNGHWSWIYSARNLPLNPQGETLFQWLAKQRLNKE